MNQGVGNVPVVTSVSFSRRYDAFFRIARRARLDRRILLDAEVVTWLKEPGEGHQAPANCILTQRMLDEILAGMGLCTRGSHPFAKSAKGWGTRPRG